MSEGGGSGEVPVAGRLDALDGLRGLAVAAVLAYHAGMADVGGGLFGVDVFFVLSGFLITRLLLDEQRRHGAIDLGAFWARRARRLLPALFVLVAGVLVLARWGGDVDSLGRVRGDAIATLLYVANWHFVFSGQGYFARYGAPSPLLHTWSLAVEEQFYLVWPVVVWAILHRWGHRAIGAVAGVGALASAGLMAALALTGMGTTRLYDGTDTRAQALLVGAALAARAFDRPRLIAPSARRAVGAAGWVGAAILIAAVRLMSGDGSVAYRGGFFLVALATAAVLASLVWQPHAGLGRALAVRPLRAVGRISYGLYLYHWPLFLWLDSRRVGASGAALLAVRLAATLAVAIVSYRLIEVPARRRVLRVGHRIRPVRQAVAAGLVCAAGVAAVVLASLSPVAATAAAPGGLNVPAARPPGPPTPALLVGDSLAVTLGEGLGRDATRWGVALANRATLGCDLDADQTVRIMGQVTPTAQGCPDWRRTWAGLVRTQHPAVVLVLLGRWEELDRLVDGRWIHVGEAAWDDHLVDQLEAAIDVLGAGGAHVVLLTLPYIQQLTDAPNGSPWDMNQPGRADAYNADVRRAVAARHGTASVIDLNRLLGPAGRYTSVVDGVRVRSSDDEHISVAGGEWLRPVLLPPLVSASPRRPLGA